MELINAYKTKLSVNNKQKAILRQHAGASRYVYNVALASWQEQYELHKECPTLYAKPSEYTIRKAFNAIKDDVCIWIREYPYCIVEWTTKNLGEAYKHFYRKIKEGLPVKDAGIPKFKGRGFPGSFGIRGYKTEGNQIYLGRSIGWIDIAQKDYIPAPIKYKENGGTLYTIVSEDAVGDWYVSVTVYEDFEPLETNPLVLGIDLGVKDVAILSNGKVFNNPRFLQEEEKRLARLQRESSRRKKGSSNRAKTKVKIAKLHRAIARKRKHYNHQISQYIVYEVKPSTIVIESLNVKGMMKNHKLAKAVGNVGMYQLKQMILYKAERAGIPVIKASPWYPSSKTCSQCGHIKRDLTLSDRDFICPECGLEIDRDLNASYNLRALADREVDLTKENSLV